MVSLLDHSDLQCPDGHGQLTPGSMFQGVLGVPESFRETRGYVCEDITCRFFVTQIAFLQNSHGTPEQRRARIREIGIGRTPDTVDIDDLGLELVKP